jgi:hypothetical protein
MVFQIEYIDAGRIVAIVPIEGSQQDAVEEAKAGLLSRRAAFARIVDVQNDGWELVELVAQRSDAQKDLKPRSAPP